MSNASPLPFKVHQRVRGAKPGGAEDGKVARGGSRKRVPGVTEASDS